MTKAPDHLEDAPIAPPTAPPTGRAPRWSMLTTAAMIAELSSLAWWNRFVQDDAFISFRYAANAAKGFGLVYNPGERVEGYTNFLWTLLLTGAIRAGAEPVLFSQIVGIASFAGTLLLTARIARAIIGSSAGALMAVGLLGTNYSFSAYATGGLETQFQTMLCLAVLDRVMGGLRSERWGVGRLVTISLLAAAAVLTRMDSIILAGGAALVAAVDIARKGRSRNVDAGSDQSIPVNWPLSTAGALAWLILPGAVVVGAWLGWKYAYYGSLVPNTFYAKGTGFSAARMVRGLYYVGLFPCAFLLIVPLALWVRNFPRFRRQTGLSITCAMLLPAALWLLYVVKVGGDFMEFRLMIPITPVLYVLSAWALTTCILRQALRVGLIALLLAASLLHTLTFARSPLRRGMESIPELAAVTRSPEPSWATVGRALGEQFPAHDVRIAVMPAGVIPYYSRLPTVDMLGLADPWVARHGVYLSERVGHEKTATIAHLRDCGVNLVISHPVILQRDAVPRAVYHASDLTVFFHQRGIPDPENLPAGIKALEIPLDPEHVLIALYLSPAASVDAKVAAGTIRATPFIP